MKILIFANSDVFAYGFKKEFMSSLIERGHEVILCAPFGNRREDIQALGCKTIDMYIDRRGINPIKDYKLYKRYKKIIKELKPDRILTFTVKCNVYGGMAAARRNTSYYASVTGLGTGFQSGILRRLLVFLYRRALRKVQKVFFENSENLDLFVKYKIIKEDKAVLVNGSGVNLQQFHFCDLANDITANFLFLGRIMREKGVDELISAAITAAEENLPVRFDFVGGMEENYGGQITKLCEAGIIKYHGYQNDVTGFIKNCHAVVLPSYHEGMSNTLLEGAAMGRPLIASDIAGCREAIEDGVSGFTVKKQDAKDLYDKIKAFTELSFEQKQKMGERSRHIVEEKFDKYKVNEGVISLLEEGKNIDIEVKK